jgi:4-hydroxy-4-methyl-2-oxoglutarate aldolase
MNEKIIEIIKKNRISSVEVADALNKTGVVAGPKPLIKGKFVVGEIQYIYAHSESNWSVHEQGETVKEGGILFIDAINCNDKAVFGDIVAKYFCLYKSVSGIVVNGLVRDLHTLVKEEYPIWCLGTTPLGCSNIKIRATDEVLSVANRHKHFFEGSIMVCDDSGCTMISKDQITIETFKKLEFIELQEDIWYYCIDTLKWSTYKTICEKAYLKERDLLPGILQSKLEEFDL